MERVKALLVRAVRGFFALIALVTVMLPSFFANLSLHSGDWAGNLWAMGKIVFKRLRHNTGIAISAVLGIVAVMGMVVCIPVFANAVSGKVLREQLTDKAVSANRGMFSLHMYYLDKRSVSPLSVDQADGVANYMQQSIPRELGLNVLNVTTEIQTGAIAWNPVSIGAKSASPNEAWVNMGLFTANGLQEKAQLVDGAWPDPKADGPLQVAVLEKTADTNFMNVGDVYQSNGFQIKVTGIWQAKNDKSSDWFEAPSTSYLDKMYVPIASYATRMNVLTDRPVFYVSWYTVVDEGNLRFDRAPDYARGLVQMDSNLRRMLPDINTDYTPLEALNTYNERAKTLTSLFYAVGGPMLVLALLFISLTATIAMQQYEQETVTMRGRGTSWLQLAMLNILESMILIVVAIPLTLLTGWGAAWVMSHTQSFLQFTDTNNIDLTFQGINYLWLTISAVVIIVARFLPILSLSRTSIVQLKQQRSRSTGQPIWQRFYLDFLLLLPGIYAYVTLSGMAKPVAFLSALSPTPGDTYHDPLLFVAPSLFAMALCMIMLRVLPFLLKLLSKIIDNMPTVWAYLSLQQVARRPQDHSSALLLIMISLSLAIYSASTAKTLDKWLFDSAYYKAGTDLVIHEYVVQGSNIGSSFGSAGGTAQDLTTTSPSTVDASADSNLSLEEHQKMPGVLAATRVGNYEASYSYGSGDNMATVMGIDRLDFPSVAFYRADFASESLGTLLNALGANPNGILVPNDMLNKIGLRVGDTINTSVSISKEPVERQFVIVGTYDYWPTVFPSLKPTLVANLDSLFDDPEAAVGYNVWMKLKPGANVDDLKLGIRQTIGLDRAVLKVNGDAYTAIHTMLQQPERVGLFGVLNVGFIATGLMPGIGFLLYSYASLRRRFIQLGILQAIGLSIRQLIGYLVFEQFILMGVAILMGAVIGLVTSQMFVPFLQIGASSQSPVPPFDVLIGWTESAWLSLAFAGVLFMTMLGTIWYLARMKVFQAVKMGEAM